MSDNSGDTTKLWGGVFTESTDEFVERFTASVSFDYRLYPYDIQGSIAHARMLQKASILSQTDAREIIEGLEGIRSDIERGTFDWQVALEDVHMNIEAALTGDW